MPPDRRRKKRTDEPAEETPRPARRFEGRRRRQGRHPISLHFIVTSVADVEGAQDADRAEDARDRELVLEGFKLKLLESATAHYELNGYSSESRRRPAARGGRLA